MAKQSNATAQITHRVWVMKEGKDVPAQLDGVEVRIPVVADTEDAQTALAGMLERSGGDVQAMVDTFNSASALDTQKQIKGEADENTTPEQVQAIADGHVHKRNVRGRGGASKSARTKAKAEKMENVENKAQALLDDLRESDPAEYERQRALFESLGLI